MRYKWKPSKTQRMEFAKNMQDADFAAKYYERKDKRQENRRSGSRFDYETAGGYYKPTYIQYCYSIYDRTGVETAEQEHACNMIIQAYNNGEKVHHDFIHIVNELIRLKN